MSILEVAINVPLHKTFDYILPDSLTLKSVPPGARVKVPFGRQQKIAIVLGKKAHSDWDLNKLKPVIEVLDEQPVLSASQLAMLQFAARYYFYPLGDTLNLALPSLLRQGACPDKTSIAYLSIVDSNDSSKVSRSKKQTALWQHLLESGKTSRIELKALGFATATIKALVDKNLIQETIEHQNLWQQQALNIAEKPNLKPEQSVVVSAINESSGFNTFLIEGVTGSGKTEVYLQAIERILTKKQQVLVLVPEIGLTPQTVNRFRRRFPGLPVTLWHSNLTDNERLQTWRFAEKGESAITIGTRSAIFMPFQKLGMIIVDEEHDSSFKQQDSLRYHARDLAAFRARFYQIPLVLGTATPSLETLHNALLGRYQHQFLTQRAQTQSDNRFIIMDIRSQPQQAGLTPVTMAKISEHLNRQKQVMVFLNRRGYSSALICHECGALSECSRCTANMTYHKGISSLICHHCGLQQPVPMQCSECGSTQIFPVGTGTEQIEDYLSEQFPDIPLSRIDRDSTRRKGALEQALAEINQPGARLLVGTQMLAKGHHFPDVSLVVILEVDAALYSSDFRATEHLAQLIVQVAGRAGRSGEPGEVLLLTHFPDHPLLQDLINNGYGDFARYALEERNLTALPPFKYMVLMRAMAHNARDVTDFLNLLIPTQRPQGIEVMGPFPAPREKLAGKYRYQLHICADSRQQLQHYIEQMLDFIESEKLGIKVKWSLDRDPVDLS